MIIFIYGSDNFRAKEKIKEFKNKFLEKNGGNQILVSVLDGAEFDISDFRNKVLSAGFFAEKKMVIFQNPPTNKEPQQNILEITKKLPEETVLVFLSKDEKLLKTDLGKFLLKEKYVFQFNKFSKNEMIKWIRQRVVFYGYDIGNPEIMEVLDILGDDLWKIDLELKKLCAYAGDNKQITRKNIEVMLKKESQENIFKFIDALATKNKRLALLTLKDEISAGGAPLAILGMIVRQIRILIQVKHLDNPTKDFAAAQLSIHPYVAGKALLQANNFHINQLKNIYRELLRIDMAVKSSTIPSGVLFDRLIVKM